MARHYNAHYNDFGIFEKMKDKISVRFIHLKCLNFLNLSFLPALLIEFELCSFDKLVAYP